MKKRELSVNCALTPEDLLILEGYKPIIDSIGQIFGSSCEAVLHRLDNLHSSVMYIHNGEKTGRSVGSPVTDKALTLLQECQTTGNDSLGVYFTKTKEGRIMRSATTVIRNLERTPIGLLCINFDISTPFNELCGIFSENYDKTFADNELFVNDVDELLRKKVDSIKNKIDADTSIKPRYKTREIILTLNAQGLFKLRNSVPKTAEMLKISKDVIYMHLRKQKDDNQI